MPIADYHKSILNQRTIPLKRTRAIEERLDTALRSAWVELDALIRQSTVDDKVRRNLWIARQSEITRLINELAISLKRDIVEGSREVAFMVSSEREALTNTLLAEAGLPLVADFTQVPQLTLELLAQRMDIEGLKLSANIWASNQLEAINSTVLSGIARGQSAQAMGIDLRAFMLGTDDFTPEELRDLRTVKGVERRKLGTSIKAKAQRIARTEINNAYWESSRLSSQQSPVVSAMKWVLSNQHPKWDVCDILAGQNLFGLGAGVYPPEQLPPKPHPNDLCFVLDVLRPVEEWGTPRETVDLQVDPDKIPKKPNGAQGTDRHIERQRELAVDLVKAISQ